MRLTALPIASILLLASVAAAADPPTEATGSTADVKPVVEVPKAADPSASAPSQPAQVTPEAAKKAMADAQRMQRVRERATQVDPKENEAMEKELVQTTVDVDAKVEKKEKPEVAGRLAAEFGGAPELYLAERERLHTSWGQLSVAHTILANTKEPMTIDQIISLRQEGLGWGQIAHGLEVNVGEFKKMAHAKVRAVGGGPGASGKTERAEAKANYGGKEKPDASANGKSDASVKGGPDATEKGKPDAGEAKSAKAKTK